MLTAYLLLTAGMWLLMLLGALRAKPGQASKPWTAASIRGWRIATLLGLTWAVSLLITGCGGGGDDQVPAPGVDCQARPELCA